MNFLSPWFLLGALAVAGPILFHLIRRWAREKTPFSSLMFLSPALPRVARRQRIEHPWLLLLRCLLLGLLATAFARPFLPKQPVAAAPAPTLCQRVVLVDTSASMRREGLWDQARQIAERYLEKASPDDQTALLTFDRQPRTLASFAEWLAWPVPQRAALAGQRLAAAAPGWLDTHLGLALTTAAEQFAADSVNRPAPTRRELVLITDLQEGAALDGLQGFDWPTGVRVILERVSPKRRTNAGLHILEPAGKTVGDENAVLVRIANASDSEAERFQLYWAPQNGTGRLVQPVDIYLPPGQIRTFTAPPVPPNLKAGALRLNGDAAEFDNVSYYVAPERELVRIAYFASESADDPANLRYYLERAFNETSRRQIRLMPVAAPIGNSLSPTGGEGRGEGAPHSLAPTGGEGRGEGALGSAPTPADKAIRTVAALHQAAFAVIPTRLDPAELKTVRDWLSAGRTALLILTDAQMGPTLAALAGVPDVPLTEIDQSFALLGDIDFRHPIFAPFAEARFSDFTRIHFWKHRRWEPPPGATTHVLARFDDGSPALFELPVGRGNLLVLASGWNPADSQLALSSKFPALIETMLDWSGAGVPRPCQFLTGEALPSPVAAGNSTQWEKPDGTRESLAAGEAFGRTLDPGIYVATGGGREQRYAVNLPLPESRTAPLAPDELTRLGVPLQSVAEISPAQAQARERLLRHEELESRQKLWRWLIAAALAVTLAEIILRGRLASAHPSGWHNGTAS